MSNIGVGGGGGGVALPPPLLSEYWWGCSPPRMSGIGGTTVTCVLPDEDLKDRAPLRASALL